MAKKDKNQSKETKEKEDMSGFNIRINAFGEMERNMNIDAINDFLNDNIQDKKLQESSASEEE